MKLLAFDSNSILNRAFYGIKLLTTKSGMYTNAIYGFLNILLSICAETKPDAVAFAFDLAAPTFRHKMYDEYKAGRRKMPDELREQVEPLKALLRELGFPIVEASGFEADDILGTFSHLCEERGWDCVIATGDRDSLQLIGPHTTVRLATTKMGRASATLYDEQVFLDQYGIHPPQLVDVKALMGDSSDHIPGVAGIGEKTALALIAQFGSLDAVYENLDSPDIKKGVRQKLIDGRESAYQSYTLARIRTDAPIDPQLDHYLRTEGDRPAAVRRIRSLEMYSMIDKLGLEDADDASLAGTIAQETLAHYTDWAAFAAAADIGTLALTVQLEEDQIVRFRLSDGQAVFESEELALLDRLLADRSVGKYTCQLKELWRYALAHDIPAAGFRFDATLAAYLLAPTASSYDLPRLLGEYRCAIRSDLDEDASDCAGLCRLCPRMAEEIHREGMDTLLYEIEMPLAEVLASMELVGFAVDADALRQYGDALRARLDTITEEIYTLAGHDFNLNSPKQLGIVLFEELGLPFAKKTKSGYSTNVDVLELLRPIHPIAGAVLEYRKLQKLVSTYVDGLLKVIGPDGRIHSRFNQTETRTGRISSTDPNMQNIPVRTPEGSELRKFFKASPGQALVDADYSQIELRVLASIADDPVMIEAFNEEVDIHQKTASEVFDMPLEMVTPQMRSRAKAVNFGIVYGIGAFSLSQDIGVSVAEADQYIKGYLGTYKGVDRYMKETVEKAKELGYVTTLLGRRRPLPELSSQNRNLRAFGERVARNTPIQGTAADIIKIAMVRVYRRLREEELPARLILQVHDELIVEAPAEETAAVSQLLQEEMEGALKLKVTLKVDAHSGPDWYHAKG